MIKPGKLQKGDKVATVTLSWGGAGTFPHRYEAGKKRLREVFGLEVVETPHARKSAEWIEKNPKARAEDLMWAFEDKTIKGILSIIGGEDSIRTLPFIDLRPIRQNPKVFMGFSDTTVTHFALFKAGLVSFYGTSVMVGFAENGQMFDYEVDSIQKTLFSATPIGKLAANQDGWTSELIDWANPEHQSIRRKLNPSQPWHFLQGGGTVTGKLLGGCLEVMEFLKGTDYWPSKAEWAGKILFFETSEEMPAPSAFRRMIWNYAAQGIINQVSGILMGRPYENKFAREYEQILLASIAGDLQLTHLPIVTRLDFGHTSPALVLPLGVELTIDCDRKEISINENAVT